jgi:hypothetical protein
MPATRVALNHVIRLLAISRRNGCFVLNGDSRNRAEAGHRIKSWNGRLPKYVNCFHEIYHLPLHAAGGLRALGPQLHAHELSA